MKVTLHMAVSIDGYIARPDGDSGWVSALDAQLFEARCREAGCIALGRKTFDQYRGELYPIEGIDNIVLTRGGENADEANVFCAASPEAVVARARARGREHILLAGGGKTNAAFLAAGLIDEIFLTVHPVVLGQGIKLFGEAEKGCDLALIDSVPLGEGLVQLHYGKK